jgi:hypothetical protein
VQRRASAPEAAGFLSIASRSSRTGAQVTANDLCAESMAIKRILEARAGTTASFARGMSYRPGETLAAPPARRRTSSRASSRRIRTLYYRAMRDDSRCTSILSRGRGS